MTTYKLIGVGFLIAMTLLLFEALPVYADGERCELIETVRVLWRAIW